MSLWKQTRSCLDTGIYIDDSTFNGIKHDYFRCEYIDVKRQRTVRFTIHGNQLIVGISVVYLQCSLLWSKRHDL